MIVCVFLLCIKNVFLTLKIFSMKTITQKFLFILAFLPFSMFGQIVYNFDAGGNGYGPTINGTDTTYTNLVKYGTMFYKNIEVKSLSTLGATDGGDGNTSLLFHGAIKTGGINTNAVDLTAFTGSNDQQVVWKAYLKTSTTASKGIGVILRAQSAASTYSNSARQGYFFMCYGSGTAGSVKFRVLKYEAASTSGLTTINGETTQAITGFTNGPLYLKAKAVGTSLSFEYSTDGVTYTAFPGSPYTDTNTAPNSPFTHGTVQLAWGLGGGSILDQYFDDVTIKNLDTSTAIDQPNTDDVNFVIVQGNSITVNAKYFDVYTIQGLKVNDSGNIKNNLILKPGIYVVKSGSKIQKIIIN
jgi:hypothetical protein